MTGNSERAYVMVDGVAMRRVDQVQIGDALDLENDMYADPEGYVTEGHNGNPEFQFGFARVDDIATESACTVLHTTQGVFAFPHDHMIGVDAEQVIDTEESSS